ncbi:hypothetical protein LS70_006025, partial [Helicobacter sp. MIT 11-5569]|uniref:Cache 3/Cache 2 fusion domain-containing protein n=1 Tax=Helicobacter sp. MIT 11-5569 TaxID=1548151 RepID=UPI001107A514
MDKSTQDQIKLQITQMASIVEGNFEIISNQIIRESDNSLSFFENAIFTLYGNANAASYQLGNPTTINQISIPSLMFNGINLVGNTDLVDNFSNLTGGVATIFVRKGNEFVRISTSLKNEQGNRMIGTSINSSHPAFAEVTKSNPRVFRGKVQLAGKDYMSIYKPILNAQQQTIGLLFVAYGLKDSYELIAEKLNAIRIGKQGKIVVLDKTNDKFIFGKDGKPSDYQYLQNLKQGTSIYHTINGEKYESYVDYNSSLDLYILVEVRLQDFMEANQKIGFIVIFGIIIVLAAILIASFLIIRLSLLNRLNGISKLLFDFLKFLNHETKTPPHLVRPKAEDEIGKMALAINQNIEITQQGLKQDETAITQSAKTAKTVEEGNLTARIIENPHNPQLVELKNVLNNMLDV